MYMTIDRIQKKVAVETRNEIVLSGGTAGAIKQTIVGKRP